MENENINITIKITRVNKEFRNINVILDEDLDAQDLKMLFFTLATKIKKGNYNESFES